MGGVKEKLRWVSKLKVEWIKRERVWVEWRVRVVG